MAISTTFSATFSRSSLPLDTHILRTIITDINNQYEPYSRTCAYVSSVLEGVDFTVSYAPVAATRSFHIIIAIASVEGLVIFLLDISNAYQNTILTKTSEIVYLSLPYIYLDWYKRKWPKHPLDSNNKK